MQESTFHTSLLRKIRIIYCIVLAEYLLFIFSGVSFSFLHGNNFFSLEADPALWMAYLLKIPQFITANHWMGISLDIATIVLLLIFIWDPFNNRVAIILFVILFLFYVTLMGYLTHHNYQSGVFLIFIPFLFRNDLNRRFAYESIRYFILFFYVSAALLKSSGDTLLNADHFSHLLSGQFTPYFLEGNTGWRTNLNLYLLSHHSASYALYILSFIAELIVIVGFFTKRFDKWIAAIILIFHFSNWLIMDIAPFGQIAFICLLFISREMGLQKLSGNK